VEQTLQDKNVKYTDNELERIFLPFLEPRIRLIIQRFDRHKRPSNRWKGCRPDELVAYQKKLHSFDKRRLHYLRCGRVNMGDLDHRPWKFLNVLLEKSRDEIEHLLQDMEKDLPPYEIRSYLYGALQLQTHFRHLLTRNHPGALDPEKVDQYFLEDVCRLNRDESFFRGVERADSRDLHPYLRRYVILYFDNAFDPDSSWSDTVEDFMGRHRFYRSPPPRGRLAGTDQDALRCLGISSEDFKNMDRSDLTRHYRRQAKVAHPDAGGREETFIRITAAYECLLRLKP
jgi:hypothetical protein